MKKDPIDKTIPFNKTYLEDDNCKSSTIKKKYKNKHTGNHFNQTHKVIPYPKKNITTKFTSTFSNTFNNNTHSTSNKTKSNNKSNNKANKYIESLKENKFVVLIAKFLLLLFVLNFLNTLLFNDINKGYGSLSVTNICENSIDSLEYKEISS